MEPGLNCTLCRKVALAGSGTVQIRGCSQMGWSNLTGKRLQVGKNKPLLGLVGQRDSETRLLGAWCHGAASCPWARGEPLVCSAPAR